ncbi:Hydrophobic surface binding protein [Mycena kentingensis (nom. inval.)]|nr:Hydrophobic surface binding protein [Mycena kentingensis (nom. inval.)]
MFGRLLTIATVAAAAFGNVLPRDAATVKTDITNIAAQVTTLDNNINAFPASGGTLTAALAIHNSAVALISTINGATTDATNAGAFSEDDGAEILASVEAIEPTIFDALEQIVVKKPAFQALPIGGLPALILQDLTNLKTSTVAFANALIADSPADLVDEATTLRDDIAAAFDTAIAAYSS